MRTNIDNYDDESLMYRQFTIYAAYNRTSWPHKYASVRKTSDDNSYAVIITVFFLNISHMYSSLGHTRGVVYTMLADL